MDPSMANTTSKMTSSSPTTYLVDRSNPNFAYSIFYQNPSTSSTGQNSNYHFSYPDFASSQSTPSLNYADLLHQWNYHRLLTPTLRTDHMSDNSSSEYYSRNDSLHQYYSNRTEKSSHQLFDDEIILKKFHRDTFVNLDTGESKNIQQLTKNDLLKSAKQSHQYSRFH